MVLLQEGATLLLECEEYYRRAAEFMDVNTMFYFYLNSNCKFTLNLF